MKGESMCHNEGEKEAAYMIKKIIIFVLLIIMAGCRKTPEIIIDDEPVKQPENGTVTFSICEEEGALVYSAEFSDEYRRTIQDKDGEYTVIPEVVVRFYKYSSDDLKKDLERYAIVLGDTTLNPVFRIMNIGNGASAFYDYTGVSGSYDFTIIMNDQRHVYSSELHDAGIIAFTNDYVRKIENLEVNREYLLGYTIISNNRLHTDSTSIEDLVNRTVIRQASGRYTVIAVTLEYWWGERNNVMKPGY